VGVVVGVVVGAVVGKVGPMIKGTFSSVKVVSAQEVRSTVVRAAEGLGRKTRVTVGGSGGVGGAD